MTVVERILHDGRRLFAARSVVPLVLAPVVVLAAPESWRMEQQLGAAWSAFVQWSTLAIALAGLGLRCATVAFAPDGTSSRDTHGLRAPSLNTTGMYSLVRHPLYLGSGIMWVGVAASSRVWWLAVIVAMTYGFYVERLLIFEEAFLASTFPQDFRHWASRTPAFLPRLRGWVRPAGRFQWRRVLSEHNGLLSIAILFPLLQLLEDVRGGESVSRWCNDHADLLVLSTIAIAISIVCIAIRRLPRTTESAHPAPDAGP